MRLAGGGTSPLRGSAQANQARERTRRYRGPFRKPRRSRQVEKFAAATRPAVLPAVSTRYDGKDAGLPVDGGGQNDRAQITPFGMTSMIVSTARRHIPNGGYRAAGLGRPYTVGD